MPDSHELILAAQSPGALLRLSIDDHGVPTPVRPTAIGAWAMYPSIGRSRDGVVKLVFARVIQMTNIWRASAPSAHRRLEIERVAGSTRIDYDPSYSPDASRIAFASNRSGSFEIWVCARDGSDPRQLTSFNGPDVGSPRWSPDGRHIVFDAQPGGNPDIYVIESDGGPVQRITTNASDDARPSWSSDGRMIYFRSDRGGLRQIWRIPFGSRAEPELSAERVTMGPDREAFEAFGGKWVYFVREPLMRTVLGWWMGYEAGTLWRVPARGGQEEKVMDGVRSGQWGVSESSIFIVQDSGNGRSTLVRASQQSPEKKVIIGEIERRLQDDSTAFTVSRDGHSFLMALTAHLDADLYLVNDFR
jgi:Tol biopolymer transport system component